MRCPVHMPALALVACIASSVPAQPCFERRVVYDPPNFASAPAVVAADFNGDGSIDLASPVFSSMPPAGQGAWLQLELNSGRGRFIPFSQPLPERLGTLVCADLDADGDADVIAATFGDARVYVLINDGSGTFTALPPKTLRYKVDDLLAVDADGDGDIDVLASTSSLANDRGDLEVLLNAGNGTLTRMPALLLTHKASRLAAGDFDLDGVLDVIAGCYIPPTGTQGRVVLIRGEGQGVFTSEELILTSIGVGSPLPVDIDRDGDLDLLIANYLSGSTPGSPGVISQLYNQGNAVFVEGAPIEILPGPADLLLADLDQDRVDDLITAHFRTSQIAWRRGQGGELFETPEVLHAAQPSRLLTTDFNADQRVDIAYLDVTSGDIVIEIRRSADETRDGLLTAEDVFAFLENWFADAASADLNGSGHSDAGDLLEFIRAWFSPCR